MSNESDDAVMDLVAQIDAIVTAHFETHRENTGFDALSALGYFAGVLLASAPDPETRTLGYNQFSQFFSDGLKCESVTKH